MKKIAIVFPHQLFDAHPALSTARDVCLVEDRRFFTDFNFRKKKLVFHLASMHVYKEELVARGYRVQYIKQGDVRSHLQLTRLFARKDLEDIYVADMCDEDLSRRLEEDCLKYRKHLHVVDSPSFLNSDGILQDFFMTRKHLSTSSFYIGQRKRLDILVNRASPSVGSGTSIPKTGKGCPNDSKYQSPESQLVHR